MVLSNNKYFYSKCRSCLNLDLKPEPRDFFTMPLKKSIDKKKFYSEFTFFGEISFVDFKSELENLSRSLSNFNRMPMIWDFRRADLSQTRRQQIDHIAEYFYQKPYMSDKVRVACVADTDLQYGLCRILQFYMDEKIVETKTFKDYRTAVKWISEIQFVSHNLPVNISVTHSGDALKRKSL